MGRDQAFRRVVRAARMASEGVTVESLQADLAEARRQLEEARISNRDSQRLINELNQELAASQERERERERVLREALSKLGNYTAGLRALPEGKATEPNDYADTTDSIR